MRKLIEKSVNAMAFTDWFKFAVLLGVVTISQISTIHEQIIKMKTRVCLLQLYNHCPNSSIAAVKVKLMKELFCKHFQSFLKFQNWSRFLEWKVIGTITILKVYGQNSYVPDGSWKSLDSIFIMTFSVRLKEKKSIMNQISQRMSVSTSQT